MGFPYTGLIGACCSVSSSACWPHKPTSCCWEKSSKMEFKDKNFKPETFAASASSHLCHRHHGRNMPGIFHVDQPPIFSHFLSDLHLTTPSNPSKPKPHLHRAQWFQGFYGEIGLKHQTIPCEAIASWQFGLFVAGWNMFVPPKK